MRYFKLALAAGASIVVAARLSPAHALPPVYPLDANGPIRQGHLCLAPAQAHFELESFDTGPGYSHFYECGRHKRAHREAGTRSHGYATHGYPGIALQAPSYHHLDIIGPIRQGRWCIAPGPVNWRNANFDTGYGYDYFYECAPVWAAGGHHYHQRHAHHARHHQRHHPYKHHYGHHRQALHPDSPATQGLYGMMLSHGGGDAYAVEQDQPSWQTIASAEGIDAIVDTAVSSDGGIVLANENVLGGGDSDIIIGDAGNDGLRGDGGVLAQLVAAEHQPVVSLEWIRIAAGEQVSHSMLRRDIRERIARAPVGSGGRHAPVDPALVPLNVLGQRSTQLQLRREDLDAAQMTLTRHDYSSPVRSEAGGGMSVTTQGNGFSPVAAVLGLVLAFATPIALVATQIPVVDKGAVIETVSDLIAETEWYVPERAALTSPFSGQVAPIKSASVTAMF